LATLERESLAARFERIRDHLNWFEAVAAPRISSPRLEEFYRILDGRSRPSVALKNALDKAEQELQRSEAQREIEAVLEDVSNRLKSSR
jgi:hypothetical protein